MDLVLRIADDYVLDKLWARIVPFNDFPKDPFRPIHTANASMITLQPQSAWPRDYIPRQLLSLTLVTMIGIHLTYFTFAWLSFTFVFNHELMRHPRFLKNQIRYEIQTSLKAFPVVTLLTLPWFQAEVMGYSRLYDDVSEHGWLYFVFSILLFYLFTDFFQYWIHRAMHRPMLYKAFHKAHHRLIIPTPFASHAFHPADAYLNSIPYHLFAFLFPLHRVLYLLLFVFANFWVIFVHDSEMIAGHPLEHIFSGPSHHTLHHLFFTVHYAPYFTWTDRLGGSYRQLESHLDPLLEVGKEKTL